MNVIIVSKFLKAPRKLCLSDPSVISVCAGVIALLLGIGAGSGYGLRMVLGEHAASEIQDLRQEIARQQSEFISAQDGAQRELNAMSVKLAELQAEATRINALGMRLTQIAHLEDGEFNFEQPPAVGGPRDRVRSTDAGVAPTGSQLGSSIDALTRQLSAQSRQLALLESVLSDRELDASLLPTGQPVRTGYASSSYGRRADPFSGFTAFHSGVDFAGQRGSDVLSVADGVVQFSGRINGYGNAVEIDHGNGYMTRYAHASAFVARPGQRVHAGETIAKVGSTGRSTGPHCHFEVWRNGRPVNPMTYVRASRVSAHG